MQETAVKNPLHLRDQLCFVLYSTSRAITKLYGPILKELGLTYPQYLSMLVLWETDDISVQELADALMLEGATTTPLVQRLEKLGLVERRRSAEDERRLRILLTDKGRDLRKKALAVPPALGCAIGVDEDQAKALIEHLKTIDVPCGRRM